MLKKNIISAYSLYIFSLVDGMLMLIMYLLIAC